MSITAIFLNNMKIKIYRIPTKFITSVSKFLTLVNFRKDQPMHGILNADFIRVRKMQSTNFLNKMRINKTNYYLLEQSLFFKDLFLKVLHDK